MVEPVDGRFTADRWPENPDANLYKEAWPTDTSSSSVVSMLSTNEEEADVAGFLAFSQAFTSAEPEDALGTLGTFMDLDYLARYMAVDDAIASYDGITYFWSDGSDGHNHNYYIYEDAPGHFTLLPWDVESTFWINPDHAAPHWTELPEDCSLTYAYWGGVATAPGCDPFFRALRTDLSGWRAAARELLDGPFSEDTMLETIDRYVEFMGDEARSSATPTMYGSFDDAVGYLRGTIPALRERLEGLIAED